MRASAVVIALALVVPAAVVAPPVALADTEPRVVELSADPGPFTVSGFAGQAQSVITVVVDDPSGAIGPHCMDWYYAGFRARLTRTSGGRADVVDVDLPRTASVAGRDTYSAPWRIAATRSGTWTVTSLYACGTSPVDPRVALGVTRTITVVGSAVPRLASAVYVPRTLPWPPVPAVPGKVQQRAVLTYTTGTGAPIVGASLLVGTEYACWVSPIPPTRGNLGSRATTLRTDARGQVVVPLVELPPCVSLLGPPAVAGDAYTRALVRIDYPTLRYTYRYVVAVPSARSVRVGRSITVLGHAVPALGAVRLQRLVGRTWRTVATAPVRRSARFTLVAPVTRAGTAYYRVVALAPWTSRSYVTYSLVATPSRAFVVRGVR